MAEKGFPIIVKNDYLDVSIAERIETESVPGYGFSFNKAGAWTSGQQVIGGDSPKPGTMWYITNFNISGTQQSRINLTVANPALNPAGQTAEVYTMLGSQPHSIVFNRFIKEKEALTLSFQEATGGDAATQVYSAGGSKVVSADFFKIGTPIVSISDSILAGTGPSYGNKEYLQLIIKYLESATQFPFRKVLKGKGSWRTDNALVYANVDGIQYIKAKFGIFTIALGMNDYDSTTYGANLSLLIAEIKRVYPTWVIWVFGPTPAQGNWPVGTPGVAGTPRETTLATTRTMAAGIVSALADPKVWYTNLGASFSAIGDTNYFTTDGTTSGNRIHPNDLGHAGAAGVAISDLEANGSEKINLLIENLKQ